MREIKYLIQQILRSMYPFYGLILSVILTESITSILFIKEIRGHRLEKPTLFGTPLAFISFIVLSILLLWYFEIRNKNINKKVLTINIFIFVLSFIALMFFYGFGFLDLISTKYF